VDVASGAVDRLFHYAVPLSLRECLQIGMRARVPFGAGNKSITAYVAGFSETCGVSPDKVKDVAEPCEDFPIFTEETLALAFWMREKYYTTLINCFRCIQPPGIDSKTKPRRKKNQENPGAATEPHILTAEQQTAANAILSQMRRGDAKPVLLHGVTGSGKTEIYIRAIMEALAMGGQAIVLVPEIALTPQTVGIFTGRFGDIVAVTHSRLSASERYYIWESALNGHVKIVIGPRSAVFMPFKRLGVIIVDEEHDHSYRSETAPKYDTREVAVKRGELTGALVIMGSATPSLETYYNSGTDGFKAFNRLTLSERVNRMFPEVIVLDMRREMAEGNLSPFGRAFQQAMLDTLNAGRQIILFMNRRGHSTFVSCRRCGHVMTCGSCQVNYTWHADGNRLLCHYCGHSEKPPETCPACDSAFIRYFGVGTQKVEEETLRLFPGVKLLRMDMDTTRGKHGHARILEQFRRKEAQILLGTQMIAKGLDFPDVVLVGVVAADLSLFTGDFRSAEHTFQLLTQVSGRAGRASEYGRVFLQSYNPEHYALEYAKRGDYEAFYKKEIALRKTLRYPPYSHVFMVLFTGPDERAVIKALHTLLAIMRYCNKKGLFEILEPTPAFVSKIKKQFRWKCLVKCDGEEPLKQFVLYCMKKLRENDPLAGITAHLTLDPVIME
jgi:primosomal protein N' (replication factor Y)